MAQHDYNIANQTGANFRADLNNALSAISSNNSGSSEPSTMYAYEWWIDTSNDLLKLRNSANNAWITMPFSITADNTVDINAGTVNGITSFSFSSGSTVTSILDEDNLASDSATALATQQSIKAYVDSQVTAQDLDITDGSSTIAIDLDSETLSLLGGTGVTSTASGNGVTFAIGQSVGTSDNVVFNQVTGALVGNASTATALATARTISGVSFDGTANITLDTDDIGEGSSNLYYTNARVDSRFDTRLATKTTDNLTEGSSNKYFTNERVDDQVNTLLTAGANISLTYDDAGGTLTIANTNSADITSVVAGNGLTGGGTAGDVTLAVGVDDSSIEINSDALRVKATGITNAMLAGSIANAKLANSSITVNSQAIALGGSHTFDTDDIGEGSSNLYYTDARANSAIDARVTNTFINNLSGVVADTSTALATARLIALSGDVTASGVNFDGTGDITLSTTIAANSVALGTDTTGNYVATIAGTTNEIDVSGSGSETATVTIGLPDDVTIAGNLTVNGTTTTVNSDTLAVTDPLIKLAKSNSGADSLDIGFYGLYDTSGSQDLYAGLFRDANDSGKFKLFKDLQSEPTTTVNTGGTGYAVGTLVSNLEGSVTGTVSSISNHSTSDLSEGTNLYYTDARFDTRLAAKTTDNLTEGSSNLYMTTERVQDITGGMVTGNTETGITVTYDDTDGTLDFVVGTLNQDTTGNAATATALETARTIGGTSFDGTGNIDLAGVNTTGNQDTSGNAATATALATGRTIGMTGDVVWTSASFDGSGNVTGTATIQANSVALGTDTTGDYVGTITGGTGITSTGATSGEGVAHSLSVDAAQTQITSVGALDGGSITSGFGSIDVGSSAITTSGTVTGGTLAGTLSTAAQPNITSVGTLTGFTSTGIDDNADATAITIDSSENVTFAGGLVIPSTITHAGDTDTKLDFNQANTLRLITGDNTAWICSASSMVINEDSIDFDFRVESNGNANMLFVDGGSDYVSIGASTDLSGALNITHGSEFGLVTSGGYNFQAKFESTDAEAAIVIEDSNSGTDYNRIGVITNDMTFITNNSERVRIDSSGNVLVGKTSTSTDVVGSAIYNYGTIGATRDGSHALDLGRKSSDGDITVFRKDGTSVGSIGSEGGDALFIQGGTTSGSGLVFHPSSAFIAPARNGAKIDNTIDLGKTTHRFKDIYLSNIIGNGAGEEITFNNAQDFIRFDTTGSERMRIDTNGNLGLGDSSPANFSGYVVASLADSTGAILDFKTTGSEGVFARIQGAVNNGLFITNEQAHPIAFNTNATERMRIDSSGNVLVGKTSSSTLGTPGFELAANDTFRATKDASAPGEFNRLTTDGDIIIFYQNTVARGSISISGANTSYNTSSDARLKDITGEARGLEVINALNPVSYNWKEDGKSDEGLIAQEVMEIVPNAVSQNEDDEYYQMDYSKLVTPLIKAIQEQQTQIDALQSEINLLKGE